MMNRTFRKAAVAAIVSAGIITPAQGKAAVWLPQAPSIIKPAEFWKPHEKKLMLAMPITLGMLKPSGGARVPGYRNTYVNTAPPANPAFAACDLGIPHATRMVVVVAMAQDNDISAVNVDGTGATFVVTSSGPNKKMSIWRAASILNPTGTITCTHGSGLANTIIHVFALYPASHTPVSSKTGNTGLTDLAKMNGGFTIIGACGSGAAITITQTGAEAIIQDYQAVIESTARRYVAHHVNTATIGTDDYTSSTTDAVVGASWL